VSEVIESSAVNAAGEQLALSMHVADGDITTTTSPVVVLCHGMEAHRQGKVAVIAHALQRAGICAVRLDHAGCGDSEGPHEPIDVERRVADVEAILAWLDENAPGHGDVAFGGSSMGAAVSLIAAARHGAAAWAGIATPIRFWSVVREEAKRYPGRGLVIWGDADDVVPPQDSAWLVHVLGDRAHTQIFEGGDHRLADHVPAIAKRMAYFYARFLAQQSIG